MKRICAILLALLLGASVLVYVPAAFAQDGAADRDLADATFGKGEECYANGDYEQAAAYYQQAADEGHALALLALSVMYRYGTGVEKDPEKAEEYYEKGSYGMSDEDMEFFQERVIAEGHLEDPNLPSSEVRGVLRGLWDAYSWEQQDVLVWSTTDVGGEQFIDMGAGGTSVSEADRVEMTRTQEEDGILDRAIHTLALEALRDDPYAVDEGEAAETDETDETELPVTLANGDVLSWPAKAGAQYELGLLYAMGYGVAQDYAQAAECLETIARLGHAGAQTCLGVLYEYGWGVGQSSQTSIEWLEKAARSGYVWAMYDLGMIYFNGAAVAQDYDLAIAWHEKAALKGLGYSQYFLGFLYENGIGTDRDPVQAAVWYDMAAEQGYTKAQERLAALKE